jgi:uncharacterized RDD family membrane protein YckC
MAVCWSCNSALAEGVRWCPTCHASQTDPTAGRLASPGKRLGAFLIDSTICFVIIMAIGALAFMAAGGEQAVEAIAEAANSAGDGTAAISAGTGSVVTMVSVIGIGALGYLLLNLFFYAKGTTPGHQMLGMRVIREDGSTAGLGTMLLREWIGKFISHLVMSLGFIWILIDANRQGWHDKVASTYVVE